ncbi:UNVERIFIED_ORG: integral membrane protein (TIGR01906 family) [Arthrobacter sp. UYCu721]
MAGSENSRGAVESPRAAPGVPAQLLPAGQGADLDVPGRPGGSVRSATPGADVGGSRSDPPTGAGSVPPSGHEAVRGSLLGRFLQVLVAVFFPVIVVAGAVRAVTSPLFLWVEYQRPGFPVDIFGFSTEERLIYGSYTLDYVLNLAPAGYLGGLVNAEGDRLFLESEVGHMADVKGVLSVSFVVAFVMLLAAVALCVHLARRYHGAVRRALFSGAVLTLALIVALTIAAVLAWEVFFAQLHALFFAAGTWTFRVDDTLIRLFPEQFWTDAAISIAALVFFVTTLTVAFCWPVRRPRLPDDGNGGLTAHGW